MNNAADDTATPKVTSAAVTRSVTGVVAAGALALIVVAGVLFAQGRPGARRATAPSTSPAPAAAVTAAAAAASSVNADIADFAFSPNPIIVTVGSTVTWTNKDAFAHTIKFAAADAGPAESPSLGSGATFAKTFTAPGTYAYICGIHNSMTGSVTVK